MLPPLLSFTTTSEIVSPGSMRSVGPSVRANPSAAAKSWTEPGSTARVNSPFSSVRDRVHGRDRDVPVLPALELLDFDLRTLDRVPRAVDDAALHQRLAADGQLDRPGLLGQLELHRGRFGVVDRVGLDGPAPRPQALEEEHAVLVPVGARDEVGIDLEGGEDRLVRQRRLDGEAPGRQAAVVEHAAGDDEPRVERELEAALSGGHAGHVRAVRSPSRLRALALGEHHRVAPAAGRVDLLLAARAHVDVVGPGFEPGGAERAVGGRLEDDRVRAAPGAASALSLLGPHDHLDARFAGRLALGPQHATGDEVAARQGDHHVAVLLAVRGGRRLPAPVAVAGLGHRQLDPSRREAPGLERAVRIGLGVDVAHPARGHRSVEGDLRLGDRRAGLVDDATGDVDAAVHRERDLELLRGDDVESVLLRALQPDRVDADLVLHVGRQPARLEPQVLGQVELAVEDAHAGVPAVLACPLEGDLGARELLVGDPLGDDEASRDAPTELRLELDRPGLLAVGAQVDARGLLEVEPAALELEPPVARLLLEREAERTVGRNLDLVPRAVLEVLALRAQHGDLVDRCALGEEHPPVDPDRVVELRAVGTGRLGAGLADRRRRGGRFVAGLDARRATSSKGAASAAGPSASSSTGAPTSRFAVRSSPPDRTTSARTPASPTVRDASRKVFERVDTAVRIADAAPGDGRPGRDAGLPDRPRISKLVG